ncbi:MAG: hypothetical protein GY873_12700 [Bosea sp.]|nr:hypothetical protein [Bosea sp. (in: a-proteobacteria)]
MSQFQIDTIRALGAILAADELAADTEVDLRRAARMRADMAAGAAALLLLAAEAGRLSVSVRLDEQGRPVVVGVVS